LLIVIHLSLVLKLIVAARYSRRNVTGNRQQRNANATQISRDKTKPRITAHNKRTQKSKQDGVATTECNPHTSQDSAETTPGTEAKAKAFEQK
jgi:hypothetical protein